jgi:putative Ca2+/H+ antiporter (TMEM165/GDT1 family)
MAAFLASFMFVVLAEMGDKTQLLVMAFASKYNWRKVLLAVFLATAVNHALAVVLGKFLVTVVPINIISLSAAVSFIIFGLWTIRGDKLEKEDSLKTRFGVVLTVSIAFFLAEMGDKTQLATISLAIEYRNILNVLMGTTLGMVVSDAIAIFAGVVLRKHLPEKKIKWVSAIIFVLFGLSGTYHALSAVTDKFNVWYIILSICLCTFCGGYYLVNTDNKLDLIRKRRVS